MKKIRIPLLISIGILLVGFILGSFFDLQIAQTLYSSRNGFGIFMSAFSLLPGYGLFSMVGGMLFANTYKSNKSKGLRIFLYIMSAVAIGAASFLSGREIFSINGYNKNGFGFTVLGVAIALVFQCGFAYLGYYLFKDSENEDLWIALLIIVGALVIALIPGVTLFKVIFHRPRYRAIMEYNVQGLSFHNWYERFGNYKDYISYYGINKEEFKSFPSGHAGASMLVVFVLSVFLPLAKPNLKKYQTLLFSAGFVYSLLVMFTRMLVGAHFLSDVSMGGLLVLVLFFVANEVILRKNLLKFE